MATLRTNLLRKGRKKLGSTLFIYLIIFTINNSIFYLWFCKDLNFIVYDLNLAIMTTRIASRLAPYLAEYSRAGAIMAAGDVLAQTVVEKKEFKDIDYIRTVKYGSLGFLFVGPVLKYWFALLDRSISIKQNRLQRTVKKMLVDQSVMAPALNLSITGLVGIINNERSEKIKERIKVQYPDIMKNNYMLWPAVQMVNFSIVPLKYQVIFVQLIAVVWNCFVSQLLNDQNAVKQ